MAEKDLSSEESDEGEDKITVVKETIAKPAEIAPKDELEYQLQAERREKEKIAAGHYYTDPNDGTCYEWDEVQRAWFPRITEDFLAAYQMSYGANQNNENSCQKETECTEESNVQEPKISMQVLDEHKDTLSQNENTDSAKAVEEKPASKKQKKEPEWFEMDADKNTWVYISGLPLSMTSEEFLALVGKYGIVMEDPDTEKKRFKMYTDEKGNFKGDAKCCYFRKESIPLAIQMLNGTKLSGSTQKVKVEQAKFVLKGEYNPKLKPKKKNNKNKKKRKKQENLLDWRDRAGGDDLRPKHAKIVIMKHCFDPKEFLEDACMITEIRDDIKQECEKVGPVRKVLLFDRHPDGVVSVKFDTHEAAEDAVKVFDKRWFGGQQIEAQQWDGVTDYAIEETAKEREARLASWHKFIGDGEVEDAPPIATDKSSEQSILNEGTMKT